LKEFEFGILIFLKEDHQLKESPKQIYTLSKTNLYIF